MREGFLGESLLQRAPPHTHFSPSHLKDIFILVFARTGWKQKPVRGFHFSSPPTDTPSSPGLSLSPSAGSGSPTVSLHTTSDLPLTSAAPGIGSAAHHSDNSGL